MFYYIGLVGFFWYTYCYIYIYIIYVYYILMECLGERTSVFVIVVHPFVRCSAYNHFVIEIDKLIANFARLISNKSERGEGTTCPWFRNELNRIRINWKRGWEQTKRSVYSKWSLTGIERENTNTRPFRRLEGIFEKSRNKDRKLGSFQFFFFFFF